MATCSSDEIKFATTELCNPCFSNCKEVLAVLYCIDCDEKFCEACGACHKKSKLSKDHKLSKVTEAPPGDVVKLLKELTTCPNHRSEEVVYVCIDEDELFCNQCANTRHRQCRQLETIEQYMNNVVHKDTIKHQMNYESNNGIVTAENYALRSYDGYGSYYNRRAARQTPYTNQYQEIDEDSVEDTNVAENILPEETVLEKLTTLDQQLAEILKQDANERSMVADSVARVTAYLQAVQAKLESAVKSLRDQINTDRGNIDAINQHGNDKHAFLLRRKITKDLRDIESHTLQLNQYRAASSVEVLEQNPVDVIVQTIKDALRVETSGVEQEYEETDRFGTFASTPRDYVLPKPRRQAPSPSSRSVSSRLGIPRYAP